VRFTPKVITRSVWVKVTINDLALGPKFNLDFNTAFSTGPARPQRDCDQVERIRLQQTKETLPVNQTHLLSGAWRSCSPISAHAAARGFGVRPK
jgi:hypothetical protein